MRILGIDPGTKCGWAVIEDGERVASGVWNLSSRRHEGGGMRFVRARKHLNEIGAAYPLDAVAYEEVHRHAGTAAAHVYGGLLAIISSWCEEGGIPYEGIPVGTIKKFATGKGNANKERMVEAACERCGLTIESDNEADAIWVGFTSWEGIGQ